MDIYSPLVLHKNMLDSEICLVKSFYLLCYGTVYATLIDIHIYFCSLLTFSWKSIILIWQLLFAKAQDIQSKLFHKYVLALFQVLWIAIVTLIHQYYKFFI